MNVLLEQFISESRDLIEACGQSFLELEKNTKDEYILNEVFRHIHTVKGGSGLFTIGPFTDLLHCTEDSLSRARNGELVLTSNDLDLYFTILDQTAVWLDQLESNGELSEGASEPSQSLIERLKTTVLAGDKYSVESSDASDQNRVEALQPSLTDICNEMIPKTLPAEAFSSLFEAYKQSKVTVSLVKYSPVESSFYSGDDPIVYWQQLPGNEWMYILDDFESVQPEAFDPYQCRLTLLALSSASADDLSNHFQYVADQVEITPLRQNDDQSGQKISSIDPDVELILEAQRRLLDENSGNDINENAFKSVQRVLNNLSHFTNQSSMQGDSSEPLNELVSINSKEELELVFEKFLNKAVVPVNAVDAFPKNSELVKVDSKKSDNASAMQNVDTSPQPVRSETLKTIKVDQERLENLVDLTGELIVAKNSMHHLARKVEQEYGIKALSRDLKSEHAVLNRITESLQSVVMQIRMIPMSTLFQRFPRLVRDLSRRLDKKIELVIDGEDTEADKNIVEQLADPLIHLVRNSIDHGIESQEERSKSNKLASGTIKLTARSLEDSVQIQIQDDGQGIDSEVVKRKAIEKGLISPEEGEAMDQQALLKLIFEPGFSTKEQVSDLSGRGVGMDVVKTTVNRIGGELLIDSTVNEGTTITVTLPASITVSRIMMFEMSGQVYGIPVDILRETIKIMPDRIKYIKSGEAYVLRNEFIPLYRMENLLGIHSERIGNELPILNLNLGGRIVGLVVDKLLEGVDVIVKPLEGVMSRFPVYSGAAVLGDGRVLLVINPKEIQLCR